MQGKFNKSSLEHGSPGAVLAASTEMHAPRKDVNNTVSKASAVVQVHAPGKGSQDAVLKASRVILGDIGGNDVAMAHSSGCSTHSVSLSDPVNVGLVGLEKCSVGMEGLEAPQWNQTL